MEKQQPLNVKYTQYNQNNKIGYSFVLNNINFNWRELKKFAKLEDIMSKLKYQKFYNTKQYSKPTCIEKNDYSNEVNLYDDLNIQTISICLPCYDEEWCEISGTLRSISKNILVHKKRPGHSFQLHVNIFIIQDGWEKASQSFKEGVSEELGIPEKEWISNTLKNDSISIIIPNHEIYYPSYDDNSDDDGITFNPIFITKKQNAQKYNSHLIFFSLCYLQNPTFVFLTDSGTIFNSDCISLLSEYLYKKHSKVIGVTAKQRVMGEKTRREIQEYPHWSKRKKRISLL